MSGLQEALVVPMTMKMAQVGKIMRKKKNPLLDQRTLSLATLQKTEALCTHSLRGWYFTN